jgi:hypothetical protein
VFCNIEYTVDYPKHCVSTESIHTQGYTLILQHCYLLNTTEMTHLKMDRGHELTVCTTQQEIKLYVMYFEGAGDQT